MAATAQKLAAAAKRHRTPLTVALGALALVVLAALTIPVRVESTATAGGLGQDLARPALEAVQAEDLGLFVASRRWDVVLQDLLDEAARKAAEAAAAAAGQIVITPELAKIGFVGLMVEPDEYAVLLVLPGGKISRLAGGDTLPDGRTLVSVNDNSITLEGSDQQRDVLPLFPRVRTE